MLLFLSAELAAAAQQSARSNCPLRLAAMSSNPDNN
jgi:hypothetical protein